VDAMQAFYEKTADFEARFDQAYTYTSSHRTQKSSGKMLFKKPALMRWDYEKPGEKTIVLAGNFVYMYDAEAQTFTKAPLQADRLSASVTFLWGKGRLADEFTITRAKRTDMGEGVVLELVPRKADPRFDKLYFLIDPKTNAVTQTIVVDPDGAENHMTFTQVKVDQNLGLERFHIEPPPDTRPQDMTQMPSAPK
jgi:outer membrane lipoprotein carrier protein